MALTLADVKLWQTLRKSGVIPPSPQVLEIGQANWHGSTPPPEGCDEWIHRAYCSHCDGQGCEHVFTNGARCIGGKVMEKPDAFEVARRFYKQVLDFKDITAIDMQGPDALRLDLNKPVLINHGYDIVINTGTAEHVFNQFALFESIHRLCRVGGLMVHAAPWEGWVNHGFFNYQPCFWQDLAAANGYETLTSLLWDVPQGKMFYTAMRRCAEEPFKVPMQRRLGIPSKNGKH